ncbi:MAG: hypothetical protein Q9166_004933 [cf. Caloplaca sp. 2 TL-2023]
MKRYISGHESISEADGDESIEELLVLAVDWIVQIFVDKEPRYYALHKLYQTFYSKSDKSPLVVAEEVELELTDEYEPTQITYQLDDYAVSDQEGMRSQWALAAKGFDPDDLIQHYIKIMYQLHGHDNISTKIDLLQWARMQSGSRAELYHSFVKEYQNLDPPTNSFEEGMEIWVTKILPIVLEQRPGWIHQPWNDKDPTGQLFIENHMAIVVSMSPYPTTAGDVEVDIGAILYWVRCQLANKTHLAMFMDTFIDYSKRMYGVGAAFLRSWEQTLQTLLQDPKQTFPIPGVVSELTHKDKAMLAAKWKEKGNLESDADNKSNTETYNFDNSTQVFSEGQIIIPSVEGTPDSSALVNADMPTGSTESKPRAGTPLLETPKITLNIMKYDSTNSGNAGFINIPSEELKRPIFKIWRFGIDGDGPPIGNGETNTAIAKYNNWRMINLYPTNDYLTPAELNDWFSMLPSNVKLSDWWTWKAHLHLTDRPRPPHMKCRNDYAADLGTKGRIKHNRIPCGRSAVVCTEKNDANYVVVNGNIQLHGDDGERAGWKAKLSRRTETIDTTTFQLGAQSLYHNSIPKVTCLNGKTNDHYGHLPMFQKVKTNGQPINSVIVYARPPREDDDTGLEVDDEPPAKTGTTKVTGAAEATNPPQSTNPNAAVKNPPSKVSADVKTTVPNTKPTGANKKGKTKEVVPPEISDEEEELPDKIVLTPIQTTPQKIPKKNVNTKAGAKRTTGVKNPRRTAKTTKPTGKPGTIVDAEGHDVKRAKLASQTVDPLEQMMKELESDEEEPNQKDGILPVAVTDKLKAMEKALEQHDRALRRAISKPQDIIKTSLESGDNSTPTKAQRRGWREDVKELLSLRNGSLSLLYSYPQTLSRVSIHSSNGQPTPTLAGYLTRTDIKDVME